MKNFIVDTGKKKYRVKANDAKHAVELVKKIVIEDSQINDAGWFNLTVINLQDSSELTLTRLVTDVKKVVGSTVAEITNGRYSNGTLHLQVLVKGNMSKEFTWMELPIIYQLSRDTLRKLYGEPANSLKAQSEINAKLKQFAGKQLYKDKSIVSDSFILIDDEASQLQTVNALIEDEKAAVEAYNVAIENLHGKIPEESLQVIINIRDDENRHIENLQAVVNGTVTEKNLEDSILEDAYGAKLQAKYYKSPLDSRQKVLIFANDKEIVSYTADEAKAFANQILSVVAKIK